METDKIDKGRFSQYCLNEASQETNRQMSVDSADEIEFALGESNAELEQRYG